MSNQHKQFRLFFTIKIKFEHCIKKKKKKKLNRTDKPFILISSIKAQCLLFGGDTNLKDVQPTSIILFTPLQLLSTLLVVESEIERVWTLSSCLSSDKSYRTKHICYCSDMVCQCIAIFLFKYIPSLWWNENALIIMMDRA